ncbi:hypothetical protein XENOCAPTIV_005485 [Xenoophorus captivus]|uniref:Uncharacterized protein n=1 Tax=Xenoophorus captivus TaxID=1517983 RepID=A0ABV0R742_9TELE
MGQLRAGKRAIRIKRAKEPLLLTLCGASSSASEETESVSTNGENVSIRPDRMRSSSKVNMEPHIVLDPELYEGIVSQTIIEPKAFTAAVFSCCLFVGLSALSFVLSK